MSEQPLRSRLASCYSRVIVIMAAILLAQLYTIEVHPYLNLRKYALGQERMPFQARELMRYPMMWAGNSAFLQQHTTGRAGMKSPERLVLMLANIVSILVSTWAALKIDRHFWPNARARLLPFAALVLVFLFNFYISVPYAFPYDLPAMMFLGVGLYLVLTDQFAWLLPVFALGTWDRETTLFLILAKAAIAVSREGRWSLRALRRKDVLQLGVLSVLWVAIEFYLHYKYRANLSEAGPRIKDNLMKLMKPVLWPAILSGSAFLMPWIYWRRDLISSRELRACVLLLPFWVLMLLTVGQILEVRIYGDISVFIAVCATAILRAELGGSGDVKDSAMEENAAAA